MNGKSSDGKEEMDCLQQWVADFGNPRAPVALAYAAVALLRPGHAASFCTGVCEETKIAV